MPELTFVNGITSEGRLTKNGLNVVRARAARASHAPQTALSSRSRSTGEKGTTDQGSNHLKSKRDKRPKKRLDAPEVPHDPTAVDVSRCTPSPPYHSLGFLIGGSEDAFKVVATLEDHARFMQTIDILVNDSSPHIVRDSYQLYAASDTRSVQYNAIVLHASVSHAGAAMSTLTHEDSVHDPRLGVVIRGLRQEMEVPLEQLNQNETTTSIIMLSFFEMVHRGANVQMHRDGLERLVSLFGGPDKIDFGRLRFTISMGDINTSIYLNRRPFCFMIEVPQLSPPDLKPASDKHFSSSPACQLDAFDNAFLYNPFISVGSIQQLRDAFFCFEQLADHTRSSPSGLTVFAPSMAQRTPKPQTGYDAPGDAATTSSHLNECIARAASLWWHAVYEKRSFGAPSNSTDIETLFRSLTWISSDTWRGLPYVYLWILLVGFASSQSLIIARRWFFAEVNRCGLGLAAYSWPLFRHVVNNFMWLQALLRGEDLPIHTLDSDAVRMSLDTNTIVMDGVSDRNVYELNVAGDIRRFPRSIIELSKAARSRGNQSAQASSVDESNIAIHAPQLGQNLCPHDCTIAHC